MDEIDERMLPGVSGPEERYATSPQLAEALLALKDRDREVIALRFGGDLTGAEIATVMGLSLANVEQIVSRSLRRLRGLLGDVGEQTTGAERQPSGAPSTRSPGG
jgi:RNA polymerase sigma-70 factor (ECF subfamily)